MKLSIKKIDAFIFDFDGVITDNLVYVDQNGKESVSCSRADGLAFKVLHQLKKPSFILSTENNPVVSMRAQKLKVTALQGINNKLEALNNLTNIHKFDLKDILYVGNDLNDYYAMRACGYSVCPSDSHSKIREISDIILGVNGGKGVVRCLLEDIFNLDFLEILYKS